MRHPISKVCSVHSRIIPRATRHGGINYPHGRGNVPWFSLNISRVVYSIRCVCTWDIRPWRTPCHNPWVPQHPRAYPIGGVHHGIPHPWSPRSAPCNISCGAAKGGAFTPIKRTILVCGTPPWGNLKELASHGDRAPHGAPFIGPWDLPVREVGVLGLNHG